MYTSINYQTPIYQQVQSFIGLQPRDRIKQITHVSTNCTMLPTIISTAFYLKNISLSFRTYGLSRNHSTYDVNYCKRITTGFRIGSNASDATFNNILNLLVVNVTGNITNCFETYLPTEFNNESGWVELNGISIALKQSSRHRIRVYKKDDTVIIFTAQHLLNVETDNRLLRNIFAVTPLLLPDGWSADANNQNIVDLCRGLTNNESNAWLLLCQNYFNSFDAFVNMHTHQLREALRTLNNTRAARANDRIVRLRNDIENTKTNLRILLQNLRDENAVLLGTDETALSDDDIEHIINKKIIEAVTVRDSKLYFSCTAPVTQYDRDAALMYYNKTLVPSHPINAFTKLFKAVFIDEKYVLHFTDNIIVSFNDCGITAHNRDIAVNYHTVRGLPNPHHFYYNCWGSYEAIIAELISQYNYMQLLLQIKAAVGSLNMTDYTVLNRFKEHIISNSDDPVPCVYWKSDNAMHTLAETIIALNNEGGSNNEAN